jgi:hypothetical protein
MKKSSLFYLLSLIGVLVIVYAIVSIKLFQKSILLEKCNNKQVQYNELILALSDNQMEGFINTFRRINGNLSVIDCLGDTVNLNTVIGSSLKIVFRYTELNCNECVNNELTNLKSLGGVIGNENIIIITSYSRLNDMIRFRRANQLEFPVYNIGINSLGLDVESRNIPYTFLINSDLTTHMVFAAIKEYPDLSKRYYQVLAERFKSILSETSMVPGIPEPPSAMPPDLQ